MQQSRWNAVIGGIAGVCLVALTALVLAPIVSAKPGDHPRLRLDATTRGEKAITTLGIDLPAVARSYGMSATALKSRLRHDRDLAVDSNGRLFFSCSLQRTGLTPTGRALTALAPPTDTFALHSRPGAPRLIYLDFDGATLVNTCWNAYSGQSVINAPPWNSEGDAATFSTAERTAIQAIWQRVAEDYLPFDVDVTTEPPSADAITRSSSSDYYYGTVVLISPLAGLIGPYGGIAYVGIYDLIDSTDYYKPALVFPENLGPYAEKYVAEAASHEAGHNLGLAHDGATTGTEYYAGQGSGETGWAPIMGVGYYRNLTQWSKGEYLNANCKEDDLVLMQTNGLHPRPDDVADTLAGATPLPIGTAPASTGVIATATDVDVFSFTAGAGLAVINVRPADLGANLDIEAEVLDAAGSVVAVANPIGYLAGTLSPVLPEEGLYFVRVHGTGEGDPLGTGYSTYGSLGQYAISASLLPAGGPFPPTPAFAVTAGEGEAPLTVDFDASGSVDSDGVITSHEWAFGDGATGTGSQISHTYASAGVYTATLTVRDSDGLQASASRTITVTAPNRLPTAVATATPTTGAVPLAVVFDGASSSDPDGTIGTYEWAFGDGGTGSGASVTHMYAVAGSYTALLTVTDDRDGSASAGIQIIVRPPATPQMKIESMTIELLGTTTRKHADVVILITDANGAAVSGAKVSGSYSGVVTGTVKRATAPDGSVTLTSRAFTKHGEVHLTVTAVTKAGVTYTPSANLITSVSALW